MILLVYVDDTRLYAKDMKDIDHVIERLRHERKLALEVEDDVAGFLGVNIKRDRSNGRVELTQEGLTNKIIEALDCDC